MKCSQYNMVIKVINATCKTADLSNDNVAQRYSMYLIRDSLCKVPLAVVKRPGLILIPNRHVLC